MASMFCFQCEQTAKGTGCSSFGVCGKDPEVAALQDVTLHMLKGLAQYASLLQEKGQTLDSNVYKTFIDGLFLTVTNVNFDADDFLQFIKEIEKLRESLKNRYDAMNGVPLSGPAAFIPAETKDALVRQAWDIGIEARQNKYGADVAGLQELLLYGLKGTAAYAHHAAVLGKRVPEFEAFMLKALKALADDVHSVDELFKLSMECGHMNYLVMEALDAAHNERFGHPEPTVVRMSPVKGKAIVVSGHDLYDLESLLKATEGKGINVYTHGEMLPAHAYPQLKKYKHLVGNYGSAWQNQAREFDAFPGAILMTTNCIQKPLESYKGRIFTTGLVGWPGVRHLKHGEWEPLIQAALEAPGFTEDAPLVTSMTGFGHHAVLSVADKVVQAVKDGHIKRFVLIGGCDGAKPGRDYYTQLAEKLPQDTVILTLACGKYRFNTHNFGTVAGLPRLLDMGQCNDAYSALRVALALAQAFNTDVNNLPLSLVLSWYEQKAVAILLTLLNLGMKNIRIGPSLPAFITPNVLNVLVDKFAIKPIGTVESDIAAICAQ